MNTGLFGTRESFVPLADASFTDKRLTVVYTKDKVKDAPDVGSEGHLTPDEERQLYGFYGLSCTEMTGESNTEYGYTGGRTTTTSDGAITRSEERLEVGTRAQEAGRARLRKYVDTDYVEQTVPVRKERAVIEREAITDANVGAATSGQEISEDEHEVVLHEEAPVVEKTVEPVERVRLGTEQVTTQETVGGEVRKERIAAEGEVNDPDRRTTF